MLIFLLQYRICLQVKQKTLAEANGQVAFFSNLKKDNCTLVLGKRFLIVEFFCFAIHDSLSLRMNGEHAIFVSCMKSH